MDKRTSEIDLMPQFLMRDEDPSLNKRIPMGSKLVKLLIKDHMDILEVKLTKDGEN